MYTMFHDQDYSSVMWISLGHGHVCKKKNHMLVLDSLKLSYLDINQLGMNTKCQIHCHGNLGIPNFLI